MLAAARLSEAVARITVTRGIPGERPTRAGCWVEAEPLEMRLWPGSRTGRASVIYSKRPLEPGSLGRHKTTSRLAYHLARDEARAARADETLLVTPRGEVLEGSVSNLFAVFSGFIRTPPLAAGILPGITRAWVIDACAVLCLELLEGPIQKEDLAAAQELFLTNSVQEVVPVAELCGRPVPEQAIGLRLREAYRQAVARASA